MRTNVSLVISGAVGNPFPGVQVAIGKPDIQNHNKYNIIATGNSTRTTVSKGNKLLEYLFLSPLKIFLVGNFPSHIQVFFSSPGL